MANLKFELNPVGVGQLLKSNEMVKVLQSYGNDVAHKAGYGYKASTSVGKKRANAFVRPKTPQAYYDNLANNTLLKALQ